MKTGTDRSLPGYDGGTRHPCPFCSWYLDAEPILEVAESQPLTSLMDVISQRLSDIHRKVLKHMGTEHPDEYRETTELRVDMTG
jgi:hypothetical protein